MLKQLKPRRYKLFPAILLIIGLVLVSLACSLSGVESSNIVRIRKILPTLTPTAALVSQAEAPVEAPAPPVNTSLNSQVPPAPATPTRSAHLPTLTPTTITELAQVPNQPVNSAAPLAANPTATPTPSPGPTLAFNPPNLTATPLPPFSPNPTVTPPPPPSSDPDPTPRPEVPGWSFVGVQTSIDQGNTLVVGELVNNTGSPQQAVDISGVFYDANDQVLEDEIDTLSHVPVDTIPVGAHIPFELVIESAQPIYRLDLTAMSEPASNPPRQDFQFANVSYQTDESNMYCLNGQVQNSGSPLEDYLIIIAIGYNNRGTVVSFGEYSPGSPETVVGDQTSPFELCLDSSSQQIAHHELRALGY